MITPQLTEQYGQVERVSEVREIFSACVCAMTGATSKPKADRVAPPAKVALMKVLLETSIVMVSVDRTVRGSGGRPSGSLSESPLGNYFSQGITPTASNVKHRPRPPDARAPPGSTRPWCSCVPPLTGRPGR